MLAPQALEWRWRAVTAPGVAPIPPEPSNVVT
ncbi:hypothetical protein FHS40_001441 [Streptomyces spectabilis]|uniref:Uncharacterized protein n=1 Tax=Streptomyces spectabilis TaxID=68270 RepID=A0A7W8ESS9_STRST|nr:hypothetical protein [Streptomyces spectabilis]